MTDIYVSARRGAGAPAEILYGTVTFKPTLAHSRSTSIVLPAPTTFDLIDGEVVATNVQPTPEPVDGQIEWAYEVTFKDRHSKTYSFLVGVPDSTSQVNFTSLPRYFETRPPLFGEGPKGEPGEAATVAIGSVTDGTSAQVTNSGTNTDAVLDFVLPKGDKGDKGDGVPAGGTALQYLRKDVTGANTEWATLSKATIGLSNVDNTSDLNKPVSTAQSAAITTAVREATSLPSNSKVPGDKASTYPPGVSVTTGRVEDGWPHVRGSHTLFTRITTERPRTLDSAIQYATAYLTINSGSYTSSDIMYRISDSYGDWGSWQTVQSETSVNNTIQKELGVALSSTVNTDELQQCILFDSYSGVSKALSNGIATFFHVPFKLRVTSLNLIFDTWSISPDEVNYTTFTLRKYDPTVPAGASIATKHTSTEGITPRKPWLFDAVSWSATTSVLERGQTLSIGWANQGSAKVDMPMLVTIGYEPL